MSKKTLLLAASLLMVYASFAGENSLEQTVKTPTANEEAKVNPEDVNYYERKFSAITEMGSVITSGKPYFTIYQVIGARVNPYFFIGQGFGLQVANSEPIQIQTTLDIRTYVLARKVTPMFTVQAGYNKAGNGPVDERNKLKDTQFTMRAGTGILIKAKENASFTINGGYTIFTDFNNNIQGGFVRMGYVF